MWYFKPEAIYLDLFGRLHSGNQTSSHQTWCADSTLQFLERILVKGSVFFLKPTILRHMSAFPSRVSSVDGLLVKTFADAFFSTLTQYLLILRLSSPLPHPTYTHRQKKSLLRDPPSWGDWTHLHCIHLVSFSGRHLNTETPTLFLPLVCTISVNKILITTLSLNCCPIWSLEHLLPWVYLLNLAPFWNRIGENWNLVSYNIL